MPFSRFRRVAHRVLLPLVVAALLPLPSAAAASAPRAPFPSLPAPEVQAAVDSLHRLQRTAREGEELGGRVEPGVQSPELVSGRFQ